MMSLRSMFVAILASGSLAAITKRGYGDAADGPLCGQAVSENAVYLNPTATVPQRVQDLLNHMCWDEKVAQMGGVGGLLATNNTYNATQYQERALLHNGTISPGSYLNHAQEAAVALSDIIVTAKEENRLGIPYLHLADAVNGPTLLGTTLFPATLSMAASWNLPLYTAVTAAIRDELYAIGVTWVLSPECDAARDLRNGRVGEMYGEDAWMNGEFATTYISTMQQKDASGYMMIATTLKHYVYGSSAGGVNEASLLGGINHICNVLALPYINVFKKVMPASVMPSYATVDGVPSSQNAYMLQDLLRDAFGFDGVIASDADAVAMLYQVHKTATDLSDAGIKALAAGVQLELAIGFPTAFEFLVGNKTVNGIASNVNEAVSKILSLKFQLGVFDRSLAANTTALATVLRSDKHLEVARNITSESIVLLKNDGILPLKSTTKIALLGPFAEIINTGTYAAWTNADNGNLTLLAALDAQFPGMVEYIQGVDVLDATNSSIDSAVAAAKEAGLAILALGSVAVGWEDSLLSKKTDGEGDSHASLKLPGLQEELLAAVLATSVPTILVLSGGQAFELVNAQGANAILHGFLGGEFTGRALVDVLIGAVNPSGKLTITFPIYSEVNPVYYNREFADFQASSGIQVPSVSKEYLYPFGYGLSYTTFNYANAALDRSTYGKGDTVTISVALHNSGSTTGKETVQVYFRQEVAPLSLPIKQLVGFSKVELASGGSTTVSIQVPVSELGYYLNGKYMLDSGAYQFWIGANSDIDYLSAALNATIV